MKSAEMSIFQCELTTDFYMLIIVFECIGNWVFAMIVTSGVQYKEGLRGEKGRRGR